METTDMDVDEELHWSVDDIVDVRSSEDGADEYKVRFTNFGPKHDQWLRAGDLGPKST